MKKVSRMKTFASPARALSASKKPKSLLRIPKSRALSSTTLPRRPRGPTIDKVEALPDKKKRRGVRRNATQAGRQAGRPSQALVAHDLCSSSFGSPATRRLRVRRSPASRHPTAARRLVPLARRRAVAAGSQPPGEQKRRPSGETNRGEPAYTDTRVRNAIT